MSCVKLVALCATLAPAAADQGEQKRFLGRALAAQCPNAAFSQCDGMGWNGLTCCPGQCSCVRSDDSYSQCRPADGGGSCDAAPSPSPAPPSPPGSCENTAFSQCGGVDFRGATCCPGQCSCVRSDDYYSQCRPADGGSSCDAVPSPSPAPPSPPGSCENTAFSQCGGVDFHGATCCPGQCSCARSDDYYSQCRPADGGSSCSAGAELQMPALALAEVSQPLYTTYPHSGCAGPMSNSDFWGTTINDGTQNKKNLAEECLADCSLTMNCKSWTWKTDSRECWLKSDVGGFEALSNSVSGFCQADWPPQSLGCGTDIPGWDNYGENMNDGTTNILDHQFSCRSYCAFTPGCFGWTWKTDSKQCWLKKRTDTPSRSSNSVSGFCDGDGIGQR